MSSGNKYYKYPIDKDFYDCGYKTFYDYKKDNFLGIECNCYNSTLFPHNPNIEKQRRSWVCGYFQAKKDYLKPFLKDFFNDLDVINEKYQACENFSGDDEGPHWNINIEGNNFFIGRDDYEG